MRSLLALLVAFPFGAAAQSPAPVPNSPLLWELRDGSHPRMGPITVAVPSSSVVTGSGKERVNSLVFLSCEKNRGKIAIELANAAESDPKGGLAPRQMPRLMCNPRNVSSARTEITAQWTVSDIGDALARGLSAPELRRCASIEIVQDVALPRGWSSDTQRIEIELIPYKKELDAVLASCKDVPVVAAREDPPAVKGTPPPAISSAPATPPPRAVPPRPPAVQAPAVVAPAREPPPREADDTWKRARTISVGRTNVRAAPALDGPQVAQLPPGMPLLAQPTGSEWLRVKPRSGTGFSGYVRQDRLAFE